MNPAIFTRLSIMMFIQFFIWGAWYVSAAKYLGTIGFDGTAIGWTYTVGPIAGILSPFFVGMVADRFFATERVLGALHILGGLLMFLATVLMKVENPSPLLINLIIFGHMLCFYPTLALTNTLAMHHVSNTEKYFPWIRVFGTIGWIAAGVVVGLLMGWDDNIAMFYLAAGTALIMGVYSFSLPHTPPAPSTKAITLGEILGRDAWYLFKNPSFLIFIICSMLICIPLAFYYQLAERAVTQAGISNPTFKMTFGQMSEIIFMLIMPFFFARLGVKWMLAVGMLAWVVRYALFALGSPVPGVVWMMLAGVVLHGICYDFFFVTGQIYTDKMATKQTRAQAQGLLVLFTLGIGMAVGAQVGGYWEKYSTPEKTVTLNAEAAELGKEIDSLATELKTADAADKSTIESKIETKETAKGEKAMSALQAMQWQKIWGLPAIFAAIVLVIFVIAFKDNGSSSKEESEAESHPYE